MDLNSSHFLFISAALFAIGFYAAIRRRNIILVLIGIELMVNAAVINLVAFANVNTKANAADGKLMALFAIVLSAAAIALALAIVVKVYQYFNTINPDQIEESFCLCYFLYFFLFSVFQKELFIGLQLLPLLRRTALYFIF